MDRPPRRIPTIQDTSFIEDSILNIPPPPIFYEFGVEDCYLHPGRKCFNPFYEPPEKPIITVKSVTLFIIAACIVSFIVFSPLLHYFL
ncbi:hypothetical protein TNIN_98391 [Trichonephila inaurata madagascariensis]|uniref:Uncharacterized protein n=1 Tax=Trichonephila inaurata madagascariensis TaxID=2747483 RepID=A0A8X7CAX5_9ARAC|nr:hypothetical protein TNIN_98391 [Trichonephila inaurata madagascariensis]